MVTTFPGPLPPPLCAKQEQDPSNFLAKFAWIVFPPARPPPLNTAINIKPTQLSATTTTNIRLIRLRTSSISKGGRSWYIGRWLKSTNENVRLFQISPVWVNKQRKITQAWIAAVIATRDNWWFDRRERGHSCHTFPPWTNLNTLFKFTNKFCGEKAASRQYGNHTKYEHNFHAARFVSKSHIELTLVSLNFSRASYRVFF